MKQLQYKDITISLQDKAITIAQNENSLNLQLDETNALRRILSILLGVNREGRLPITMDASPFYVQANKDTFSFGKTKRTDISLEWADFDQFLSTLEAAEKSVLNRQFDSRPKGNKALVGIANAVGQELF